MLSLFLYVLQEAEDPCFIAKLYLKYKSLVRSEICKVYPNKNDTEDLMQEVFLRLIRYEEKVHAVEPDKMACYIAKATRRTVATFLMKKYKDDCILYLDELEDISDGGGSLERIILDKETTELCRTILEAMKPRERQILQLKYDEELTDDEIAEEMGLQPRSVHAVAYKARKRFEKLLDSKITRDKRFFGDNTASLRD